MSAIVEASPLPSPVIGRSSAAPLVIATGLSLSIGWGIRGNFGHEMGALIPGALAAMAAVLLSGRDDWHRKIAYFGAFGAVGWCWGGSISYMQVIGYTHSGQSPSVLYGFACLFVIGFLWAAMGGAGTALPAFLDRKRLAEFFVPLIAIYAVWIVQEFAWDTLNGWAAGLLGHTFIGRGADFRHDEPLYWFDTSWTSVLLALVTVSTICLIRRRVDRACSLILHMGIGWWVGFLVLVVALGLRMTPPRGDSWAGCLGMAAGMYVWLQRNGLPGVTLASLIAGFTGGIGFAGASMLKLVEVKSGYDTNWHSILEQTYGLFNGLGIAAAMLVVARIAPQGPLTPQPPLPERRARGRRATWRIGSPSPAVWERGSGGEGWTDWFAPAFVLLGITYLNLQRDVEEWVKQKAMPDIMAGLSAWGWFNLTYLVIAVAVTTLMVRHMRRPIAVVPATWLGKGQLLYLALLWWMVIGNFGHAIAGFTAQRLVTEGVITLNAVICTVIVLICAPERTIAAPAIEAPRPRLGRVLVLGTVVSVLCIVLDWGVTRAVWGDRFAGYSGLHIRFGPNATVYAKPKPGAPHP